MSEFKDYTDDFHRSRTNFASSVSAAKRKVLEMRFHPLLAAALFGHVEVVAMLIGSVNVDFQDKSHRTALWYAIEDDRLDVIKLLLKKGATITNIVASKNQRSSPFICAADVGNKTALEMMLNELHNRSTPAKVIKEQCETACYRACLNGFANIVDFLLRHKVVDVNLCVRKRRLLHWASQYGSLPTVKALVSHGAIMEKETDCGVVSAIFHGYWDEEQRYGRKSELGILLYLLESGCNVANGGLHACALWRIVHASKTVYAPERRGFNGTPAQRNQIIKLLQRNGFDKKKCQNKCWQGDFHDILERKLYSSQFLQYITELSEGSK